MAFGRSAREPFDRPFRALRVYWPTHLRLRLQARADRRAGLPLGMNAGTTPVLQGLIARHAEACERERTRFHVETRTLVVRLRELEADVRAARAALAGRDAEVDSATIRPTAEQLALRFAGEEGVPSVLVRQRRQTTHDRAAAAAARARDEARTALDELLAEEAGLAARLQNQRDVTRSRVLRYGDFMQRQAAIYRRALLHKHPDREALAHDWDTDICPAPAWVTADDLIPSVREAGVPA